MAENEEPKKSKSEEIGGEAGREAGKRVGQKMAGRAAARGAGSAAGTGAGTTAGTTAGAAGGTTAGAAGGATAGAAGGAGAGATAGGTAGLAGGPAAPITVPAAAVVGTGLGAAAAKWGKSIAIGAGSFIVIMFMMIISVFLAIFGGGAEEAGAKPKFDICSTVPTTLVGSQTQLINDNVDIYKEAAKEADIPWEVLAAIHYKEHGNSRETPFFQTDDGVYQIVSKTYPYPAGYVLSDSEFLEQSIDAAKFVQSKATNSTNPDLKFPLRQNMDPSDPIDQANIKDGFWGYNGRAGYMRDIAESLGFDPVSEGYEGSHYVMNNWDVARIGMDLRYVDQATGELVVIKMINDGAWKIFIVLLNATYDGSGKIVQLNDVCLLDKSESTETPTGCPVSHGKVGGWLYRDPAHPTIHNGIDMTNLNGLDGDAVRVTHTGTVIWASETEHVDAGYFVVVENITYKTRYLHLLANISVTVGQKVIRGDVVGTQGSTGDSTGPHLHYEVYKDSVVTDPTPFIPMPNERDAECKAIV